MTSDRYLRQTIIPGWDQPKLYNASIAVMGSGPLAISTLMALSMLGFGDLNIYDNDVFRRYEPEEFLYFGEIPGTFKVDAITRILKSSNPELRYNTRNIKMGITWNFLSEEELSLMDKINAEPVHDLIIDATNNPHLEKLLIEYGKLRGVPVINASAQPYKGEVKVIAGKTSDYKVREGDLSPDYHRVPQDPIISGLIGGVVAEEARRIIMPLEEESIEDITIAVNFLSRSMLGQEDDYQDLKPSYDKTIVVVGAGALGVNVVRGLVQRGVKQIVVYDKDTIEELNLNRQFEFSLENTINRPKASTLAKIASQYNPASEVIGIDDWFTGSFDGIVPDAMFRCTDSFKTSDLLNKTALKRRIPLFYAATTKDDGQACVVIPGKTPCLDDVFSIGKFAEEEVTPAGCVDEPLPSVCTTNMILSYASLSLFDLWCSGVEPPIGYFNYYSKDPDKVSVIKTDYECKHFKAVE